MPKAAATAATSNSASSPAAQPVRTLQCFKPGAHVAMSGHTLNFAESDLAATAGAYDPALHEAPLVVGHPKLDAPAYGWVSKLQAAGGGLEATPHQVNPEFAALVNAGAYKKMSAAFWAPDAPGNPVPGVYYLRHVGFLGATAPAVKGLRAPALQFAQDEEGVVEFSDWDDTTNASLWRSLRDWVIGKFGIEAADAALPSYLVGSLETSAAEELALARAATAATTATTESTTSTPTAAFAQPHQPEHTVTEEQKTALEAENARLRKQIDDSNKAQRQARLDAAHADAVAFADGLVATKKLPLDRAGVVVALFDAVASQAEADGKAVQFAQGSGDAAAHAPLLPAMRQLLSDLPEMVEGQRVATPGRAAQTQGHAAVPMFAAPAGATVDPERAALDHKARTYMRDHPGTDYVSAVRAVGG